LSIVNRKLKIEKGIERLDEHTLSTLTNYTLPQILVKQAQELGSERTAIREKNFGIWQTYNWNDYLQYTKKAALGLAALGLKSPIITRNGSLLNLGPSPLGQSL